MKFIIGIILGVLAVIFAAQNGETVSYNFIAWTLTAPRAIVLLAVLIAGILIGWLFSTVPRFFKRRKDEHEKDAEKKAQEKK